MLDAGGFDETLTAQSADALSTLSRSFIRMLAVIILIGVLCLIFFYLTDRKYRFLVEDLEARRHKGRQRHRSIIKVEQNNKRRAVPKRMHAVLFL